MDLYFAGAETPQYLHQLHELGVTKIAISFFEWQRRHSNDELFKHIPKEMDVCITAGVSKKVNFDFKSFSKDYIDFCEGHADQALIYDMDNDSIPHNLRAVIRRELMVLPNTVAFPYVDEQLSSLADEYERIGINATIGKSVPINELRRIQASLYGSNITDPKKLRGGRFVATTSFAWLSGLKYGELWLFSNNALRHYKAESLARAVRARRPDIEALGVDPEACAANDKTALTQLAVISLQAMADSLSRRRRDNENAETVTASTSEGASDHQDSGTQGGAGPRHEIAEITDSVRPTITLPLLITEHQDGARKVRLSQGSVRRCDSCNLSEVCPGYVAQSSCAYSVPVEIKTREQWEAASQVLLEAQFQRTMHGAFVEQVDGGDLTPRVGQEMDRWFKMLASIRDLETTTDLGEDGPLTRFFKKGIGMGSPSNDQTEEDGVIEGEVLEDGEAQYFDSWATEQQEDPTGPH